MSGTWLGRGRALVLGVCLALALLLFGAREANAGQYRVAQCGWWVGVDADWWDTTGGAKFRQDAWCGSPFPADPFDGAHVKTLTKGGGTVSGTRFGRWRWVAPPTAAITRISGTWWQALHDGMEQRLGSVDYHGGFHPFATAGSTNVGQRGFVADFPPSPAFEDRLLCARGEDRWCSLDPGSWSSLVGLTFTIDDHAPPGATISGHLTDGGWRRGSQRIDFSGSDSGAGVQYGETTIDGARVSHVEYDCSQAWIEGEWRGTRMQPCLTLVNGSVTVNTWSFSDGTHSIGHCATDYAGNAACVPSRRLLIDNNPPAHPRGLKLTGGEGWRTRNDFDFSWSNPDQGPASPIGGAHWRIVGPAGFDSGAQIAWGRNIAVLADRTVPRPGAYRLQVWLRDEAGNFDADTAVEMPMRLDDIPPGVAFEPVRDTSGPELPETVTAEVADEHSGAAGGEILYRRLEAERWLDLPTKFQVGKRPGSGTLVARLPEGIAPGAYVFRAEATDVAGNRAASMRRADGTEMVLRRTPPPGAPGQLPGAMEDSTPAREVAKPKKARLFARLGWRKRRGEGVTVPFGAAAWLSGRLLTAEGAGLAGRALRVVSRPSPGAIAKRRVETVRTGERGGFRLELRPGPSRRITVGFDGEPGFAVARRPGLALRVRSGLLLHAGPRQLRTGEVVRIWGRVRSGGAGLPRRGKLIAVQYYEEEARRWRPVLVTRSDHDGRFRASYRFRYVSGTARIRLRAVALAEERWPYVPGASRSLTVRVRGSVG